MNNSLPAILASAAMDPATITLFTLFGAGALAMLIIGFYSLLTTRNIIRTMISLELLSKGVMLLLIVAGNVSGRLALAQAMAITLILIEVAVLAVGVGIILCFYRQSGSLDASHLQEIQG